MSLTAATVAPYLYLRPRRIVKSDAAQLQASVACGGSVAGVGEAVDVGAALQDGEDGGGRASRHGEGLQVRRRQAHVHGARQNAEQNLEGQIQVSLSRKNNNIGIHRSSSFNLSEAVVRRNSTSIQVFTLKKILK